MVRPTIVLGTDYGCLPVAGSVVRAATIASSDQPVTPREPVRSGLLTLRLGSPESSFPLARGPLVIPSVQPAELIDSDELIRTTLRPPPDAEVDRALQEAAQDPQDLLQTCLRTNPEDLMQTTLRQPTDAHTLPTSADPEDLIHTTCRPPQAAGERHWRDDAEALFKTTRLEPHEFLDTVALRELSLPPELEARLPPPPPRARTEKQKRQPPPLPAARRAATASPKAHVLSRTIKRAQSPALDTSAPRGLWGRWRARSTGRLGPAWAWAVGLGACSMCLTYAITDRILSAQQADRPAVLRQQSPQQAARRPAAPSHPEAWSAAGTATVLQAGTPAR